MQQAYRQRLNGVRTAVSEVLWSRRGGDRRLHTWPDVGLRPRVAGALGRTAKTCNVCGWSGAAFLGGEHSEAAACPLCGSVSRDRFLYWCWTSRTPYDPQARVLETSPRMREPYRTRMAQRTAYLASDYDGSAHKAAVRLDLQRLALPDDFLDVVLTPHVLEHVPDTGKALSELHRVLKPGGVVLLQVPVPQARTGVPTEPEYHGDNTLVHFRFGWDLADTLREHGFSVDVLVTEELAAAARTGRSFPYGGDDCDVDDLMAGAGDVALEVVATQAEAARMSFLPPFQFITFEARKPHTTSRA